MLFELIEYNFITKTKINIVDLLININKFEGISYYDQYLRLNVENVQHINKEGFKLDIILIREITNVIDKNNFSIIIPLDFHFLLLETEGNSIFKSQILNILNSYFQGTLIFFPIQFSFDQEWQINNKFEHMLLKVFTDEGIKDEEDVEQKERFPIYSSILEVIINNKVYPIVLYYKGFKFPPRMTEKEILLFLNEIKDILI